MDWCVVKTGIEMFDALHAYGLGILLAQTSGSPVKLIDVGATYLLQSQPPQAKWDSQTLLETVLALPTDGKDLAERRADGQASLQIGNLDGMLALLFTSPGTRAPCVAEVASKS